MIKVIAITASLIIVIIGLSLVVNEIISDYKLNKEIKNKQLWKD